MFDSLQRYREIMIIIFGSATKGAPVRKLIDTYCYQCKREVTWDWFRVTEWMSAFFVPVLPLKSEHFLVCPACRDRVRLKTDELRSIKRLRQLAESDSRILHDRLVQRLEDHQLADKTATQRVFLKTHRQR